jgi:hypothetical protein
MFDEFLFAPPVGAAFAAELGIPLADVTIEREKPNTATAPPRRLCAATCCVPLALALWIDGHGLHALSALFSLPLAVIARE